MKTIKMGSTLTLPGDAVTQTIGVIARKGAGKTYLAGKLAEGLLDMKAQTVILDPVGNWWGLRLSADGKKVGYNITVLGGFHGDVPLSADSGALIAEFIVKESLSVVLDVSEFSQAGRKKFVTAFAIKLFELKKRHPSPIHIIMEEAQLFCPQVVNASNSAMVGAIESIVRLGRNYGIGSTMVSQRPQSINKEVLNQVECLFVLQINGAHERKAIEAWIYQNNAPETKAAVGDLPGLDIGWAMVWSPQWLKTFKKHKIGKKKTFDGSATPKMGAKRVEPRRLAKKEIAGLEKSMANVIDDMASKDPTKLKATINMLKGELAKQLKSRPAPDPVALQKTIDQAITTTHGQYIPLGKAIKQIREDAQGVVDRCNMFMKSLLEIHDRGMNEEKNHFEVIPGIPGGGGPFKVKHPGVFKSTEGDTPGPGNGTIKLPSGAVKMAHVLVTMHPRSVSRVQLGTLAGFTPTGGTFGNYLKRLKQNDMMVVNGIDFLASDLAISIYGHLDPVPTDTQSLLRFWKSKVPKGAAEMLEILVSNGGHPITKEDLAEQISMTLTGGTFGNYIKRLVSNGIADRLDSGLIRASQSFWAGC